MRGGEYYGPAGRSELRGPPARVTPTRLSRDEAVARRLWGVSEQLTDVRYTALGG